jgi:hypothetical protein
MPYSSVEIPAGSKNPHDKAVYSTRRKSHTDLQGRIELYRVVVFKSMRVACCGLLNCEAAGGFKRHYSRVPGEFSASYREEVQQLHRRFERIGVRFWCGRVCRTNCGRSREVRSDGGSARLNYGLHNGRQHLTGDNICALAPRMTVRSGFLPLGVVPTSCSRQKS